MYMSAIFYYPERLLDSGYAWILRLNPLWCIIDMFRGGFLGYVVDSWHFLYAGCFAAAALLTGLVVFKMEQDKFVLNI